MGVDALWQRVSGGYCEHHYVPEPPGPHGVCYEVLLLAEKEEKGIGYIALSAYGMDGSSKTIFSDDGGGGGGESGGGGGGGGGGGRMLTAAQVDRLCVLPGYRGVGVKEALLRAADGEVVHFAHTSITSEASTQLNASVHSISHRL